MDEVSLNSEPVYDDEGDEFEIEGDCAMTEYVGQTGIIQNPLPPAVGMEFESYEDVYYFYNCYAKEQGFGVRVSNTWYRKSKERYRGKLSCSSAGFKKKSEANRPRPETRTGCPAMIKFRLMETKRWRIIEVELEHNHLISPTSGKFYKSHKTLGLGTKRPLQSDVAEEVQTIRLFRTVIIDADGDGNADVDEGEFGNNVDHSNQLRFKEGDAQAVHNYFCSSQLMNPNFFYSIDLNEKGCLRNVFWADARSRVAYGYFGDVVAIDTTCLTFKYEVPLVSFIGVNHHGHRVLLGCGLVAGETIESYIWLFRAWLTCMLGRPPQTIITAQCRTLQASVADVFLELHIVFVYHLSCKNPRKLGGLLEFEAIKVALSRAVYYSLRADEFEATWEDMIQHFGIRDHKWLQALYEDRKRWVPAYLKDIFLAGMFPNQQNEVQEEALADLESRNSRFVLKPRYYFEFQLEKLYTSDIFKKFQREVEEYTLEETRDYEVSFDTSEMEVFCVCGLFNFKGYLCRHALTVLNQNGMEEIPPQYILSRWRKDTKRTYVLDHGCSGIDINNPVHRYDHLYRCVVQVVEEARKSQDRYKDAIQALDEILNKVHLIEDHPV
ncbi:hypothetical protein AAG906_029701 [Vitis piasezkii]